MNAMEKNGQSIAWFNLHEFVKRKEREKALNIYRLLSISIQNKAFSKKLLADIFYAMQENELALKNYIESAEEYIFQNKFDLACEIIKFIKNDIKAVPVDFETSIDLLSTNNKSFKDFNCQI